VHQRVETRVLERARGVAQISRPPSKREIDRRVREGVVDEALLNKRNRIDRDDGSGSGSGGGVQQAREGDE